MQLCRTIVELRKELAKSRVEGKRIGLVATMGALHPGHLSLVEQCMLESDVAVVSIFVNPAQFSPDSDLGRYPRNLEGDCEKLKELGVHYVFHPEPNEIYPSNYCTWVDVEQLTTLLDGASRPGYFRGVATVVLQLLNITQPSYAYFGQKDAQQAAVIQRLCSDLHLEVDIRILPIVREPDGLAMSSRNTYLSHEERRIAPELFKALESSQQLFRAGQREAAALIEVVQRHLISFPILRKDYVEVVDTEQFQRLKIVDRPALLAIAFDLNGTRLIDNIYLEP